MTSIPHSDNRKNQEQWTNALASMLPISGSIETFEQDNPGVVNHFIEMLKKNRLIDIPTRESMEDLIRQAPFPTDDSDIIQETTFEEFMQNIVNSPLYQLTADLNALIIKLNLQYLFNHKKIGPAMFSRLKSQPADTAIKRNYLRILAFYLGWFRGNTGLKFHFERLLYLCAVQPEEKSAYGVRIGFSINIIDINTFKHLRELLKGGMAETISYKNIKINTLTLESMFALYIDIPNTNTSNMISNSNSYRKSIREAVSLAYLLLIRWQLRPTPQLPRINLTIGIMAGNFSELTHLRQILITEHQTNYPQIKITQFAKKCITENNVRVTYNKRPETILIPNEIPIIIWKVEGAWSWIYNQVLHELILHKETEAYELIYLPNQYRPIKANSMLKAAVKRFYKNTLNTLLGMEIAKTLYYQKDFLNATRVLHSILQENPQHITALTFKMAILYCQASSHDDPEKSELQFYRAEDIAESILRLDHCYEEDSFTEIGMGRLARAIIFFRKYRRLSLDNNNETEKKLTESQKHSLVKQIKSAEKAFIRGTNAVNTGHRALYYTLITRTLLAVIKSNQYIFSEDGVTITDHTLFQKTAFSVFNNYGLLPENTVEINLNTSQKLLKDAINSFGDSVQLQCYKSNICYVFATLVHDFGVNIYPEMEKKSLIMSLLEESLEWAEKSRRNNLYIYSNTRYLGELLSYDDFKQRINRLITITQTNNGSKFLLANIFRH